MSEIRRKYIVFDGLDNTGKTFTMNLLEKELKLQGYIVESVHFPSKSVFETDLFHKLTDDTSPDYDKTKDLFIEVILDDVYKKLLEIKSDVVLIDRMLYSTLIYQGNGRGGYFKLENKIIEKYSKLFKQLDIHDNDIIHGIFMRSVKNNDLETNEDKLKFDSNFLKYYNNLTGLLFETYADVETDCTVDLYELALLGKVVVFNEAVYNNGNHTLTEYELRKVTYKRIYHLIDWLYKSNNGYKYGDTF
jgi:thymidylate kinase